MLQAGCLPVRDGRDGLRVLLITSRYTGEWIAPKGNIDAGEEPAEAAAREAEEEAGVRGTIGRSLGVFEQPRGHKTAKIEVFVLEVTEELTDWPERGERRRRWFTFDQANEAVQRAEVRLMLEALGARFR